jgi:hypothetical protein
MIPDPRGRSSGRGKKCLAERIAGFDAGGSSSLNMSGCAPRMNYRVFTQVADGGIDPALLVRTAGRHFEASVDILSANAPATPGAGSTGVRLRLLSARRGYAQTFALESRAANTEDWAAAVRAETNGRSAGMSTLAARCANIWVITPEGEPEGDGEAALLNLCGVLASAALGPVLPPDESALFGVRGAMERVEARSGRSLLR